LLPTYDFVVITHNYNLSDMNWAHQ